ncbi:hypothetical protein TeGR_g4323 [Tetraparma gracilis]|uniref:ATP synthase protein I n=1 Tax=Tetraparma gracilis TaxID=2962635 RepID=A0ABQ6M4E3_9STRA|nr:hypothetical protein TeGR_g4323 [Tetraparma gracilis]
MQPRLLLSCLLGCLLGLACLAPAASFPPPRSPLPPAPLRAAPSPPPVRVPPPPDSDKPDSDKWASQKALLASFAGSPPPVRVPPPPPSTPPPSTYALRASYLLSTTCSLSLLLSSLLYFLTSPPPTLSFSLGCSLGVAYVLSLSKFVSALGGTLGEASPSDAGAGAARFAFLGLLFVAIKALGVEPVPAVAGFFVYQLASVVEGQRRFQ